jgi:hypothetical protein
MARHAVMPPHLPYPAQNNAQPVQAAHAGPQKKRITFSPKKYFPQPAPLAI